MMDSRKGTVEVSDRNLIVYLIRTAKSGRLHDLHSFLNVVERLAKSAAPGTESMGRFIPRYENLCRMAVSSISEIEDAIFEFRNPHKLASEASLEEIDEVTDTRVVRDFARHVATGTKIGVSFLENIGLKAIFSKRGDARQDANASHAKGYRREGPRGASKGALRVDMPWNLDTDTRMYSGSPTLPSYLAEKSYTEANFLLSGVPEFEHLLRPWKNTAHDVLPIPRVNPSGKERIAPAGDITVPTTIDICLSDDPRNLLLKWEQREAALRQAVESRSPCKFLQPPRKKLRSSPARMEGDTTPGPSKGEEESEKTRGGETRGQTRQAVKTEDNTTTTTNNNNTNSDPSHKPFFPALSTSMWWYSMDVGTTVMRSLVHDGVSYLDFP